MEVASLCQRLLRRWRCDRRYHTVATQGLTLIPPIIISLFLLSGWHSHLAALIVFAMMILVFALFIQSQMVTERPARRAIRFIVLQVGILLTIAAGVMIVVFAGSFTNMAILYITYLVAAALMSEFHGRRFVQFGG